MADVPSPKDLVPTPKDLVELGITIEQWWRERVRLEARSVEVQLGRRIAKVALRNGTAVEAYVDPDDASLDLQLASGETRRGLITPWTKPLPTPVAPQMSARGEIDLEAILAFFGPTEMVSEFRLTIVLGNGVKVHSPWAAVEPLHTPSRSDRGSPPDF